KTLLVCGQTSARRSKNSRGASPPASSLCWPTGATNQLVSEHPWNQNGGGVFGFFQTPKLEYRGFLWGRHGSPHPDYSDKATRRILERPDFSCRSKRDAPFLQRAG